MKIKIAIIYILSLFLLLLCSCSQITDTAAKELRLGVWQQKQSNSKVESNVILSLYFKGDNGVIKIKDIKENKSYTITGLTIVTENQFTISDQNTLTDYTFDYNIKGDRVDITYKGKTLTLIKI